jgi:hypothetical protein
MGGWTIKTKVKPYFLLVSLLIITFSKKILLFDVILDFSFFYLSIFVISLKVFDMK